MHFMTCSVLQHNSSFTLRHYIPSMHPWRWCSQWEARRGEEVDSLYWQGLLWLSQGMLTISPVYAPLFLGVKRRKVLVRHFVPKGRNDIFYLPGTWREEFTIWYRHQQSWAGIKYGLASPQMVKVKITSRKRWWMDVSIFIPESLTFCRP